jgi:hypothetical protein
MHLSHLKSGLKRQPFAVGESLRLSFKELVLPRCYFFRSKAGMWVNVTKIDELIDHAREKNDSPLYSGQRLGAGGGACASARKEQNRVSCPALALAEGRREGAESLSSFRKMTPAL